MDEGKPAGPKPKWWSRPRSTEASTTTAPTTGAAPEEGPTHLPSEPARDASPGPEAPRPQPAVDGDYPLSAPNPEPATPAEPDAPASAEPVAPAPASAGPDAPVPAEPVGSAPVEPVASAPAERPSPLHEPDPYSTPPYGGPGPWAPAPPVQHPVATPAQGTALPQGQQIPGGAPIPGAPVPETQQQVAPAQPMALHGQPAAAPAQPLPGQGGEPAATQPPANQQPQPAAQAVDGPQSHPAATQQGHPAAAQAQTAPQGRPAAAAAQGAPHASHPTGTGAAAHAHAAAPQQPTLPGAQQPAAQYAPSAPWAAYDPWQVRQQPLLPGGSDVGAPKRKSRKGLLVLGAVALALVTGGIGGGVGAYIERNGGVGTVELDQAGEDSGDRAPDSVAGIAASALPSVVTLHVTGDDGAGTGTGFVLDRKGHILTNNHVVEPGDDGGEISVTFSGGETASAKIVGRDAGYDLAVVKVSGVKGLKPLPLGNSDNVRVGDPVVAIGAPFDLSNTVTSGIISAKERPITAGGESGSDVSYVNALQTDAPINPGNSGGPLVDAKAHVIGINSAIRSAGNGGPDGSQAGSIGLGFAIPINQGKRVAEQLINDGRATHPVIEVTLDPQFFGDGAKVAEEGSGGTPAVKPGGPADKAGIEPGDVITGVDGQRIHSAEELIVKIRAQEPGDRMKLTIERDGKERDITLTLGEADD
ncbi:trypsin-like peptidase domain-containing protein [Streptomyces sp. KLOTTS4A1]|uniref:trypsin-like peptidase domain-containing protein n=1 Tax=Streptomyces sp. KLOTTS4A1 TaxID=3390996 RepID=UPI0039F554F9